MSIRQESDLSCELLRSTLQDINYRLNNLQHVVPNPHSWKDKIQKEAPIPKLNLRKINSVYKENCIPLKKVTASFGDKIIDQVENINDKSFDDLQKKPQIKMMAEQLPQKQRSHSINCSQQVLRNQNSHSIQFKVSNASRLQNSSDFQQYQSLHQSFEKPLKSSFIGSQQIQVPQRDQSLEYVQPTLIQKPIIIEQQQQNVQTRNNSLLSTPIKQVANVSQGQTPLKRGNSSTTQKVIQTNLSQNQSYQCFQVQQQKQQLQNQDLIKILQDHSNKYQQQQVQYHSIQNTLASSQYTQNIAQFKVSQNRNASTSIRVPMGQILYGNSMIRL
ncbi:unnamed protein product (macronuclear) [Paramecium tetraurelia]|uniref:Uncharacterized protein n=1 Tax=Paramecium tetraurelia TaxID=5888 RepID=A0DQL3_PARTE|nr:uncharacterized protein GSPATT00002730001 [Paramecium tetraurelia]CAK85330.1 unnamed protein product [Paramecium tetraurelia]|eukprot:XP_001452727.1 hypothetical protein (macronuclear) [Paramecium tetraurelia strain d4-2]